jgi:hypothetical protein
MNTLIEKLFMHDIKKIYLPPHYNRVQISINDVEYVYLHLNIC